MSMVLVTIAALALDFLLGEPRRLHPLVGFGNFAKSLEHGLYADSRLRGAAVVMLLLVPMVILVYLAGRLLRHASGGAPWSLVLDALVLYVAIGWNSLRRHARAVADALARRDMDSARRRVGNMVSRDTVSMDETGISRAAVESVLENGNDAVVGAVFWSALAGAPGVALYRLGNTLDAMWGYRNERYRRFGWAAARLDDALNIVPARLTALGYAAVGRTRAGLRCWRLQGRRWKSRNAGVVMAAGAGSLGVRLGGPDSYHGLMQQRPVLGEGGDPGGADIDRALGLVRDALFLWVLLMALADLPGGWIG